MNLLLHGEHQYRMDTIPRGLCVIINNRDFKKEKGRPKGKALEPREGTDRDRDALKTTFEDLLFEVRCHDNLTDKDILTTLTTVASENHSDYDCFACCILTYGDPGAVMGVNCHSVRIRSLMTTVKTQHCASLEGKPKVFIIQACPATAASSSGVGGEGPSSSGDDGKSRGAAATPTDISIGVGESGTDKEIKLLPNETDFVLGYCTKPAFTNTKARENGSLYIQKLVKFLQKYGHSHDILELLQKVNEAINEQGGDQGGDFLLRSPSAPKQLRQDLALTKDSLRMKLRLAPSPQVQNLRVMIIGKSKRGKSSTANTIAGRDLFAVNSSFGQNLFTNWQSVTRDGRTIEITEMPTELDSEESVRPLIAATPGPHVILLCFRCEQFFSPDDFFSYTTIKKWLGKHFSKYVIMVFSGFDNTTGRGIEDVLRNSFISILRELPSPERLICLDNKADWMSRRKQGERLLRMIDRVVDENGGGHFSNRKIREFEEEMVYQQSHGKTREELKRRVVAGDEIELIFQKQCCVVM